MRISVLDLGKISFQEAYLKQLYMYRQVLEGSATHTLILCEHPHTITLSRGASAANILDREFILNGEVDFIMGVDRGGDVSYHGPGQLMGYLIFDLRELGRDLGLFLCGIEEIIIKALASFNIEANSPEGFRGVWVRDKKIASIGIGIKKWVTLHGFGLNINTDLRFFEMIRPCGADIRMTSVKEELRRDVSLELVKKELINELFARHCLLAGSFKC